MVSMSGDIGQVTMLEGQGFLLLGDGNHAVYNAPVLLICMICLWACCTRSSSLTHWKCAAMALEMARATLPAGKSLVRTRSLASVMVKEKRRWATGGL